MNAGKRATARLARRDGEILRGDRASERMLLGMALFIVLAAYITLSWSQSPQLPAGVLVYGASLAALAAVAHLAVNVLAPKADPVLLPLAFLLNGIGLVLVRRVDFAENSQLAVAQTTWTTVAVAAFVATLLVVRRIRSLTAYHYTFGLLTIVLLALPLVPGLGVKINGARLWINAAGVSFQPGELAKITVLIFLAGYLERKRVLLSVATHRVGPILLPPPRHLGPVLAAAGISLLLMVALKDLGTSLLFFGAFVTVLYIATGRLAYPLIGGVFFAIGALLAYQAFDHVQLRVATWIDPWSDIDAGGYQLAQISFALGTGGLTGTGLGLGLPDDIPYAATDAVFAVLGEELGLLGASAVLLCYLIMVGRGYKIAITARDEVGSLLAAGLTTVLGLQVFVIVGGVTRLVPFTGITMPFISYGGSSLLANYILVALLLRVSHESRDAALGSDPDGRFGRLLARLRGRELEETSA